MKPFIYLSIICAAVGLSIWFPEVMLNPGPISQGHEKIKEKCTSCHRLFWGIDNARCISCHPPDEIDKDSVKDDKMKLQFHATLKGQSCLSCHTDHRGTDPAMATMAFEHASLSAIVLTNCNSCHSKPTDSLHAELSVKCGSCHNTDSWRFSGSFDHDRITGTNKTNCSFCHRKPGDALHKSLQNNCADCHSVSKWSPATFDHSAYFGLDSDHNVTCTTCHANNNNFKIFTCYGCHAHTESNIRQEHNEEGIFNYQDCASCHRSANKHDISSRRENGNHMDVDGIRKYVEGEKKSDRRKEEHHDDH